MNRSDRLIPRSIKVPSYDDVARWVKAFEDGQVKLLFFMGRSGLGKTQLIQKALDGRRYAAIDCHATKLAMYFKLYEYKDEPIVFDDVSSMMNDTGKLELLNAACQTNPVKTLRWDSTTKLLMERGVPAQFQTTSPICVITNEIRVNSPQMRAMIDRGQPIIFQPSPTKIHEAVADWFTDREIYDFIGQWLPLIPDLSMRDYFKGKEMKAAGMDWRKLLPLQWKCSKLVRVSQLRKDPSYISEEARAQAFVAARHGSRATYFRLVRKLQDIGMLPDSMRSEPSHTYDAA